MAVLKDGSPPVAFRKIGRDGTEYPLSIVQISDDGTELSIWDDALDAKHRVTFKSYDGSTTYSSAWYSVGDTIVKPLTPARNSGTNAQGEEATYTFAGWSTQRNSSSGANGTLTAGASDIVYYAAFSGEYKRYIVKDGLLQSGYGTSFSSTNSQTGSFSNGAIQFTGGGYHTFRFTGVNFSQYSSLVWNGGGGNGWGIGTTAVPTWDGTSMSGAARTASVNEKTVNLADITATSGTVFFLTTYTNRVTVTDLYMIRTA